MRWPWYERIERSIGTMTASVQDFVDFWARHPKEFWDVAEDFPDLRPPFLSAFLLTKAPKALESEVYGRQPWPASGPSAWGVHFDAVDIHVRWSDRALVPLVMQTTPEPEEFALRGEEVKRLARWLVTASMYEQPGAPGRAAPAPTAAWRYMVAEDGSIPLVHGHPWFGPAGRAVASLAMAGERLKYLQPMLLAISAKNEGTAYLASKLLPPGFEFKLWPGRVPTIGRHGQAKAS